MASEKVLRTLLILDSLRGEDSTGIASIKKVGGDVIVAKSLGDPYQLFDSKSFDRALKASSKAIIGHNRYATTGAILTKNAHPFEFNTLVGTHNGTLSNKWRLDSASSFSVDSENLYHHIEKKGLRDAIDVAEGAWALVWWDKIEETLNFLRNDERPLFFCYEEKERTLFWASESWMLHAALSRANLKYTPIKQFEEDVHHSIHIDDNAEMFKPNLREMKKTVKPPVVDNTFKNPVYTFPSQDNTSKKDHGVSSSKKQTPYTLTKGVRLETLSLITDIHGNDYISCFDKQNPSNIIRLYHRKTDTIVNFIGEDIIGDINSHVSGGEMGEYYKVSPWSVTLVLDEKEADDQLYATANNKFLPKKDWERLYPTCSWCTASLFPEESNRFTTDGDCLCPECSVDKQISNYVNLK